MNDGHRQVHDHDVEVNWASSFENLAEPGDVFFVRPDLICSPGCQVGRVERCPLDNQGCGHRSGPDVSVGDERVGIDASSV